MGELLFKLRSVPEDEADEIRALLHEHKVPIYETTAGNWGISMPGIWVEDGTDLPRAHRLLEEYQKQRRHLAREHYEQARAQGEQPGLLARISHRPLAAIAITLFCAFIVYAMVAPFIRLALSSGQ